MVARIQTSGNRGERKSELINITLAGMLPVASICCITFNHESYIVNHESVISWDGRDMYGRQLPPGVYFLRLQGGGPSIKLVKFK